MKNAARREHTRLLNFSLRELNGLEEREFHSLLLTEARRTRNLADVLPAMITYNVPLFVLRNLFPDSLPQLFETTTLSLAVAEEGWRGRLSGLKSRFTPENQTLLFSKSHVMESDTIAVVSRAEEKIALCLVPWQEISTTENRKELELASSSGALIRHFRISGQAKMDRWILLPERHYQKIALQIPLRELTSLAILVTALHGKNLAWSSSDLALRDGIWNARAIHGPLKDFAPAARMLIGKFAGSGFATGPFWQSLFRLFKVA